MCFIIIFLDVIAMWMKNWIMKDNKLIKQRNRTNMKMADVKKIVDIQRAKTLKKWKGQSLL